MKCRNCGGEITRFQAAEYDKCCCGVCQNKFKPRNCKHCGLPLTDEDVLLRQEFCSGGCAQEYEENATFD